MRRDFEPSDPSDPHTIHAIEQAGDQRSPIDANFGQKCPTIIVESRRTGRPPRKLPANGFALVQP